MPRKPKLLRIEESGVRLRMSRRGAQWWADVRLNGERRRVSLKTTDKGTAETNARNLAKAIAAENLLGARPDTLTLGQLFTAYERYRVPSLEPPRRREAATRAAMFLEAWGSDLPVADIDQTRFGAYSTARRSLKIVARGLRPDEKGRLRRGYRAPKPLRDGALDSEFRFLNVVLNWACGFKLTGRPLLAANPIPRNAQARRALGWPVEKNPRRPVAAHDRYARTQEHTDTVDPKGRLRCILALARYTGRRESAICALHAADLLLTRDRVRAALADAGLNEADAEHMQHGAIRWREESDKVGYLFITPMSEAARAEVDAYLGRNPRLGETPLFPAPGRKPKRGALPAAEQNHEETVPPEDKVISRETAAAWLIRAEKLAELPKLRGAVFHCYRRLWAIERRHLPAIDVAAAGGWGDTQALTRIYQKAEAAGVARAVNAT